MRISDWSSDVCSSDLAATTTASVVVLAARSGAGVETCPPVAQAVSATSRPTDMQARAWHRMRNVMRNIPRCVGNDRVQLPGPSSTYGQKLRNPVMINALVKSMKNAPTKLGRASRGERVCQYV